MEAFKDTNQETIGKYLEAQKVAKCLDPEIATIGGLKDLDNSSVISVSFQPCGRYQSEIE